MPTLSFFNLESTVKGDEQRVISSYYKECLSLQKKIKNQDEEKKGKNIDGEVEKQRDERFFILFQKFIISILAYFKTITLYS